MNATVEMTSTDKAMYGGMLDAVGGISAAVLAIVGLTGFDPVGMAGIATIVFGAALLIQGGTILSEYTQILFSPMGIASTSIDRIGGEGVAAMFLVGAAGIVLGILALLGIGSMALPAIATIAFGTALLLGSSSVRQLYQLQLQTHMPRSANELLAGQMASGSAGIQLVAGLAALVLGIIAVTGAAPVLLTLTALLILGVTVLMTGSTLSGLVMSFMRPTQTGNRTAGPRTF